MNKVYKIFVFQSFDAHVLDDTTKLLQEKADRLLDRYY